MQGPGGRLPEAGAHAAGLGDLDGLLDARQLHGVEAAAPRQRARHGGQLRRRHRRHQRRHALVRRVRQLRQRRVQEREARRRRAGRVRAEVREGRVARADYGYRAGVERLPVGCAEVAGVEEGLEIGEHLLPGFFAGSFDVDEEIQRLRGNGVEDAVFGLRSVDKWSSRVLRVKSIEDGLNV